MSDDAFCAPKHRLPARQLQPSERLFEFTRASDDTPMAVELRFHGDSYGWEAQILVRRELFAAPGAFVTREAAVLWADAERKAIEKGGA